MRRWVKALLILIVVLIIGIWEVLNGKLSERGLVSLLLVPLAITIYLIVKGDKKVKGKHI